MKPMKFGIGQAARRKEDAALITGRGHYTGDILPEGALRMAVVRSPHAHARFSIGDIDAVKAMPGVELVLTAADVAELGPLPCKIPVKNTDGSEMEHAHKPILADGVVRHVGEPVAVVIAQTQAQARDAAEALFVDYEPLPAVADTAAALARGAALVRPERGTNLAFDVVVGDAEAVEAALAAAAHVVELEIVNNRLVTNYMEPRGAFAEYDAAADRFTLTCGTQGVHGFRDILTNDILKIAQEKLRVVTPDVGGGFGTKAFLYSEYPLVLVAAKRLGRTVAWLGDRSEHFVGDSQGRDNISTAWLALDKDYKFLGLKVDTIANMGAYDAQYGPAIPMGGASMLPGLYRFPAIAARIRGVHTNTVPTDAYRGAGRPEAAYLIERLVDHAARELGLDPYDLRTRNFVTPAEMPYRTATGRIYDTGDFDGHMRKALAAADHAGFEARRAASAKAGKVRGFGIATYIECCAFPGDPEEVEITLDEGGDVTVRVGTQSNGQGHETAFSQLVSQHLDLPLERVHVVQGDTDKVKSGAGTGGSRSIPIGGAAVSLAAENLAGKLKSLAADALEAATADLEILDGRVVVAGTDRAIDFAALAALPAASLDKRTGNGKFEQPECTYPNGTHSCELEVDPETGVVEIKSYRIVDDFGMVLNPLLLAGQVHGGVVQGIGQALLENTVYDESGQLLTATLQDYAVPRAADMPNFDFETRNIPSTTNLLGLKGAGEAGTIGACPAVMNALVDALHRAYGIRHIDMPATPARVWQAIAAASARAA